ncbi:hypothetical protein BDR03DRAFT_1010067 [Suillus americanus]|nr:hypothetical protein BDR03DRAFT_1010067 [Suillus americanus]
MPVLLLDSLAHWDQCVLLLSLLSKLHLLLFIIFIIIKVRSIISGGSFHLFCADVRSSELFSCDCASAPPDVCASISPISVSPLHCTSLALSEDFSGIKVLYCFWSINKADKDLFQGPRLHLGLIGIPMENINRYTKFL